MPGTLYHVSGFLGYDEDSRGVSLGDNTGNNTVSISWEASGSERWIKQAESRLTKVVKN